MSPPSPVSPVVLKRVQAMEAEKPKQWVPPGIINYADTEDVYD
jgi:hypothetical protein